MEGAAARTSRIISLSCVIGRVAGNRVLAVVYDDNPTGLLDAGVPKYRELALGPAP